MRTPSIALALAAGGGALLVGLVLRVLIVSVRDYGPTWGGASLRGNGAIVLLLPVAALAAVAVVLCLRRRAWLAAALVPIGLCVGLFVAGGGISPRAPRPPGRPAHPPPGAISAAAGITSRPMISSGVIWSTPITQP